MSKRDRGFLLREAATEIENLDFSHKGLSETATSISNCQMKKLNQRF